MQDNECLTLTVPQVSKILGLSKNSCYQACLNGQLPHLKIGKRILIPKIAIERMLADIGPKNNDVSN